MTIELDAIELRRVTLPLVTPFRTSQGTETHRDVLLVRAITTEGDGWGECVAGARPVYSPEYVDGAQHVLRHHLAPALLARRRLGGADVAPTLAPIKGHPMAKAAAELAVLDADLRAAGVSLAAHLGAARDEVPAGVAVGIVEPVAALLDTVAGYVDAGYRRVKLKIQPGWDVEPVAAVRDRFGDDLALQVDANGCYTLDHAAHLERLDPFGLLLIEQPLPDDDLTGHAELAARLRTPICLDESITSAGAAAAAIALGACSVINIKAGRVGGYLEARTIHDLCRVHGVGAWCGGMLETGIGRAANVALAALPGFTLTGDLSASDRYYTRDLTAPFVLHRGHLAVPRGPGLGVMVDADAVDDLTTSVEVVTA